MTKSLDVKTRPILFSGPMVRALLNGRKTQTRRIVIAKDSDPSRCITLQMLMKNIQEWRYQDGRWFGIDGYDTLVFCGCPYGEVGDRLWVRETWCHAADDNERFKYNSEGNQDNTCCHYRADGYEVRNIDGGETKSGLPKSPWVPSIHMPRWASRIMLEITGIRIERLNKISREDAMAEGIFLNANDWWDAGNGLVGQSSPEIAFRELWASINGEGSWEKNPWVWVVEFKVV